MRKIITGAFLSLDGVMQAPGGPDEDPTGGFEYGGWLVPHWDDVTGSAMDETFAMPFDLLLGRRTYDIFAAYWPHQLNSEIARTFDRVTKYVATHSPGTLSWQNSEALGPDVVARLRELKQSDGPVLLTQGSSVLIQTLLANELIDELRLLVFPLVLGKGKRLFGEGTVPAAFRLTKSTVSPNGVLIASYERANKVATGSFATEQPTQDELERRRRLSHVG